MVYERRNNEASKGRLGVDGRGNSSDLMDFEIVSWNLMDE